MHAGWAAEGSGFCAHQIRLCKIHPPATFFRKKRIVVSSDQYEFSKKVLPPPAATKTLLTHAEAFIISFRTFFKMRSFAVLTTVCTARPNVLSAKAGTRP